MTAVPHHHAIAIQPDDIDFMGHVNNANYLKWVQDAVIAHWQHIAPSDAVASHLWVALKHEITYRKPAFLDDDVIAEVLLEKVHGARGILQHRDPARRGCAGGSAVELVLCLMPTRCVQCGSPRTLRTAFSAADYPPTERGMSIPFSSV